MNYVLKENLQIIGVYSKQRQLRLLHLDIHPESSTLSDFKFNSRESVDIQHATYSSLTCCPSSSIISGIGPMTSAFLASLSPINHVKPLKLVNQYFIWSYNVKHKSLFIGHSNAKNNRRLQIYIGSVSYQRTILGKSCNEWSAV